jgi:hypothetical protein
MATSKAMKRETVTEYRNKPYYTGYEDDSVSGNAAIQEYNKGATGKEDLIQTDGSIPYEPAAAKRAQAKQREVMSEQQRETKNTVPKERLAKGGSVSASRRADGIAQRGKTRGKMC